MGSVNNDMGAPKGMSPPIIPTPKAQVASVSVWLCGPRLVRIWLTLKAPDDTIRENSMVMAMMFRVIGSVTNRCFCHHVAPSISAAS